MRFGRCPPAHSTHLSACPETHIQHPCLFKTCSGTRATRAGIPKRRSTHTCPNARFVPRASGVLLVRPARVTYPRRFHLPEADVIARFFSPVEAYLVMVMKRGYNGPPIPVADGARLMSPGIAIPNGAPAWHLFGPVAQTCNI